MMSSWGVQPSSSVNQSANACVYMYMRSTHDNLNVYCTPLKSTPHSLSVAFTFVIAHIKTHMCVTRPHCSYRTYYNISFARIDYRPYCRPVGCLAIANSVRVIILTCMHAKFKLFASTYTCTRSAHGGVYYWTEHACAISLRTEQHQTANEVRRTYECTHNHPVYAACIFAFERTHVHRPIILFPRLRKR